jgi:hypothetical protein
VLASMGESSAVDLARSRRICWRRFIR